MGQLLSKILKIFWEDATAQTHPGEEGIPLHRPTPLVAFRHSTVPPLFNTFRCP